MADNVNGGTLTFSDGSSIAVTGIAADGTGKKISFVSKNVTWVKFEVAGGTGANNGLSEIQVYDHNLAAAANVKASSLYTNDAQYAPENATDNVIGQLSVGEWVSQGEQNPWIEFNWNASKIIDTIVLFDRPNGLDNSNGGTLTFSDGSSIAVTGIPADGSAKRFLSLQKTLHRFGLRLAAAQATMLGYRNSKLLTQR